MKKLLPLFLFVSTGLMANNSTLSNNLERYRKAYLVPGMSAAIYQNGKLIEHAVSGVKKAGYDIPLTRDDKFHLGSCTKSMTATIAATFVEEGKLSWNTPLRNLLPHINIHSEFEFITFQDLLAHRSGLIKDPSFKLTRKLETLPTVEGRSELAKIFLSKESEYKDGAHHYSNIGYIIAGHILEVISKKSWEELIQLRLFKPLGMKSCGFGATSIAGENSPTQNWGHYLTEWSIKPIHNDNPPFYGPSANIHCAIDDWKKYLTIHLDGFNQKSTFLLQSSFNQLHRLFPAQNSNYTYGGWFREHREWANGDVLVHNGTNTYNYAVAWIVPNLDAILISTTNRSKLSGGWAANDAINYMIRNLLTKNE